MKILIITSCTAEKRYKPKKQLTQTDFLLRGTEAFLRREEELSAYQLPARKMYTGQQHVRLIRGLELMRKACPEATIELKIVSAGYGLLDEESAIVPYELTFQNMRSRELREWADFLQLPKKILSKFSDYDLTFVLLGEEYLKALAFPETLDHKGVLVFLTSKGGLRYLPSGSNILPITLDKSDARRLGAGLVALKGRVM
ncbi:MAG: queuine/archaeosine tRNA-ribosyltransferase, partial [candidate division Zixibacteria bacterium]|nr:queuine/archaeosine tRNA-ribosyltransferase [candidate division Zixibacteria bacterium]